MLLYSISAIANTYIYGYSCGLAHTGFVDKNLQDLEIARGLSLLLLVHI